MRRTRVPWRPIAAICLLLAVGCDLKILRPLAIAAQREVTVMTFNIFHDAWSPADERSIPEWSDRRDHVVETISRANAMLVGLQEAYEGQVEFITDRLPQYGAVMQGRAASGSTTDETVAILWDRERLELLDSGHFWFSALPFVPGSSQEGTSPPRMTTWVRVRKRNPHSEPFYLFNTHLASDGTGGAESRAFSARVLETMIAQRDHASEYFFVTGDFNATDDEYPIRFLTGATEYCLAMLGCIPIETPRPVPVIDTWRSKHAGAGGTRCSNREPESDGLRIDYVFVWDPTRSTVPADAGSLQPPQVVDSDVYRLGSCPSDHRPTLARVRIPIEATGTK